MENKIQRPIFRSLGGGPIEHSGNLEIDLHYIRQDLAEVIAWQANALGDKQEEPVEPKPRDQPAHGAQKCCAARSSNMVASHGVQSRPSLHGLIKNRAAGGAMHVPCTSLPPDVAKMMRITNGRPLLATPGAVPKVVEPPILAAWWSTRQRPCG